MAFKSISITHTSIAPAPATTGYTSATSLIGSGTAATAPDLTANGSSTISGFSTGFIPFHFTDTLSQNFGASVTTVTASSSGSISSTDGGTISLSGSSHSYVGPTV